MPCFPQEQHQSNHFKSFPSLIVKACAHCHSSCIRTRPSLGSEEETFFEEADIDRNKQVIILEIRSRSMKARPKSKEFLADDSHHWVLSPTTGKVLIAPKGDRKGLEENEAGDHSETGTFYSVKSVFSRCSSGGGWECEGFRGRSILEEFCHCEGWPFGLCRRAVVLPPLPSSPSDSWTWRKRNIPAKICATTLSIGSYEGGEV